MLQELTIVSFVPILFLQSRLKAKNIPMPYGHSSLLRSCQDKTSQVHVLSRAVTV